ncbi:MAG: hypothetical protein ACJ749_14980 [Flavisolibacter sp.]
MEEDFSPQQSLQLIQSMISRTKTNISGNRFNFLLWGWYTFIAMISQFVLKVIVHYEHHYFVWLGTIPLTIITIVHAVKRQRSEPAKTYIGESMKFLWTGIGVCFFILGFVISAAKEGWMYSYPFFIMLYGLGTFVSGRLLNFSPLIIGGIFNWILACVSAFVSFDYQLLCAATAILTSYIIPGHLLKTNKS